MKTSEPPSGSRLVSFALANIVPMNLLFLALVFVGLFVLTEMPVDVYPDVSLGEATIDTVWLGASAEDVERLITDRIEDEIQDIRGISWIISDSKPDTSRIRVKLREDLSASRVPAVMAEIRAAIDQVVDLPEDATKPVVKEISVGEVFFLLWLTVVDEGIVGEEVLHDVALRLKPVLREIPGVAKVDDMLVRDREVHINADRDALRKYGLTLMDLAEVLRQYNRDLPSGTIQQENSELSIRAQGSAISPEDLGGIVVLKKAAGGHVYLRDVATIETSFARKTFFARCNQDDCLPLGIVKTQEADSRLVAQRIRDALPALEASLPDGVKLAVFNDTSDIISQRIHILTSNLASGVVLVFIVLLLSVGFRNSMLAIIGIPFSFAGALIFMHVLGVTINAISLVGLVLCAGMIVDDAIVVLENIYRLVQERGLTRRNRQGLHRAIIDGTGEVLWPVVSSSATTIAAFLPLLLMVGMVGQFFAIIPKTVTVVLAASLFECLLILPVHYLDFGHKGSKTDSAAPRGAPHKEGWFLTFGKSGYDRCLTAVIRNRYFVPLPLIALAYLAYAVSPLINVQLFPSDLKICFLDVQVADEASLDQTGEAVRGLEQAVLSLEDHVSGVLTSYGLMVTADNEAKLRNNVAQMHIQLAKRSKRNTDASDVLNVLRERVASYLVAHPDSGIRTFRVWAPQSGPPIGKPVHIRLDCPDFRTSKMLAERYRSALAAMPGVFSIKDNLEFGRQQVNLVVDEDRASVHGLTFLAVASVLRAANDGILVSSFKDTNSGEALDVRLKLDDKYRNDIEDLLDLDIRAPAGHAIQVGQIADIDVVQGYAGIPHFNGRRALVVSAEVDTKRITAQVVNERLQRDFASILPGYANVRVTYGGQFAETESSFASLAKSYVIALVLIYMILATQFRSYVQPFVVITSTPFAVLGVVAGLLLGDYPFTVMTFIGLVGMTGVVVNDSILLVDCANGKRNEHHDVYEAVRQACLQRLRPVVLTTVTTVIGLLPLAIGLGGTSRIWSPFASSFVWGLTFATFITLLLVPAIYCIVHDITKLLGRSDTYAAASVVDSSGDDPSGAESSD